jgi:HTH-like domain
MGRRLVLARPWRHDPSTQRRCEPSPQIPDCGVSGQILGNWVHQADVDAGHGRPGELTTAEQQELRRLRRENHILRQERELRERPLPSSRRRRPGEPLPFIAAAKATYSVKILWRTLGVSGCGFAAWLQRGPSAREQTDQQPLGQITRIHRASRGTYGAPRVHAELRDDNGCGLAASGSPG